MADDRSQPGKESKARSARKKRRSADSLLTGKKQNTIELDEADLRKISGGYVYQETCRPK